MNTYAAKRGATLVVPLEAVGAADADLAIITAVDAGLKAAPYAPAVPAAGDARVATFAATFRSATAEIGPGWNLTLTDEQTAQLAPGTYVTDAEFQLQGGAVAISEPLFIRIDETVSR